MDVVELRLGNTIAKSIGGQWVNIAVDYETLRQVFSSEAIFKGVVIDEGILLMMGFSRVTAEQAENPVFYAHGWHIKRDKGDPFQWVIEGETEHIFDELHMLQNFMFFTTGEEMR